MSGPKRLNREPVPGIPARLQQLRCGLGLTQDAFAESVGLARNTYGRYESGANPLSDVAKFSICRTYRVNEDWLTKGEGEMYTSFDPGDTIARYTADLLSGSTSAFERQLTTVLAQLPREYWPILEDTARRLADIFAPQDKKEDQA